LTSGSLTSGSCRSVVAGSHEHGACSTTHGSVCVPVCVCASQGECSGTGTHTRAVHAQCKSSDVRLQHPPDHHSPRAAKLLAAELVAAAGASVAALVAAGAAAPGRGASSKSPDTAARTATAARGRQAHARGAQHRWENGAPN
jgi:hypothetical protein